MALTLAIVANVVGLAGLILTLRREWLDRPSLSVSANPVTYPNGTAQIILIVENKGRQPVTVGSVGLEWDCDLGALPGPAQGEMDFNDPWSRERIETAGATQVVWNVSGRLPTHIDTPMRPYADRTGGRRIRSKPSRPFRLLHTMGWDPPSSTPRSF